jgi:hypothetical protein
VGRAFREILKQLTSGTLIAFDQDPAVKPHLISDSALFLYNTTTGIEKIS